MQETSNNNQLPAQPAHLNAQNAMLGLRGKSFTATLRNLAFQGLRQPVHSARHMLSLGAKLARVMRGDQLYQPDPKDLRFSDPTWRQNPLYSRSLQAYLAWQAQTQDWLEHGSLDADDLERARFIFALLSDALAPSNSPLNPLAIKELFNTGGGSLSKGVRALTDDLLNNGGMPKQVNKQAFEVGRNLANTPGSIVFRSEHLELIQYKSMSEKQHAIPLLIVPPQINKHYIFDLSPEKSFVQYALKNSLQVFILSWRNPEPRHREWGLSTYVQALEQAIDVCREICASSSVNLLGACAGGLTSAVLQGHLQAKKQLRKINSSTYLVSLLDSQTDSPAMLFADEQTIEAAKRHSYQRGVLDGREMSRVFAWMRPNDLVWNYWINNYLLGKQPPAFDILYWNNDNTRLPAALHSDFLDFFKINPLKTAGDMEVCGTPIDLRKINIDSFSVGGINDHITPWRAVYRSTQLLGGNKRFVLSNSGHIQSILNPPSNPKANYYENPSLCADPLDWRADAQQQQGSWWPLWLEWLQQRSGERRETLKSLGNQNYPAMENAPGTYVHLR